MSLRTIGASVATGLLTSACSAAPAVEPPEAASAGDLLSDLGMHGNAFFDGPVLPLHYEYHVAILSLEALSEPSEISRALSAAEPIATIEVALDRDETTLDVELQSSESYRWVAPTCSPPDLESPKDNICPGIGTDTDLRACEEGGLMSCLSAVFTDIDLPVEAVWSPYGHPRIKVLNGQADLVFKSSYTDDLSLGRTYPTDIFLFTNNELTVATNDDGAVHWIAAITGTEAIVLYQDAVVVS